MCCSFFYLCLMDWKFIYWFFIRNLYDYEFFDRINSDFTKYKQVNSTVLILLLTVYFIIFFSLFFTKVRQYIGKYLMYSTLVFFIISLISLLLQLNNYQLKFFLIEIYSAFLFVFLIPLFYLIAIHFFKSKIIRWLLIPFVYPLLIWSFGLMALAYSALEFSKVEVVKEKILTEKLKIRVCEDWYPSCSYQISEERLVGLVGKEFTFYLPGVDNRSINDSLKLIECKNDTVKIAFYRLTGNKPDLFNDTCIYVNGNLFLKESNKGITSYKRIERSTWQWF